MADRVLIVGASARAAAASARRAGLAPITIDLFADTDARALADEAYRCDPNDYPHGLVGLALALPPTPWLYTGGLENHSDVVAAISDHHPLWGNGPDVLAKVRDRAWLRVAVAEVPGVRMADALAWDEATPADGKWLWKPEKGAGGANVRFSPPGETGGHRERFADGPVYGATFVGIGGQAVLWGVAEQLAGEPWLHAKPFAYCGSVGPVDLGQELAATLEALGRHIAAAAGLVGAWNVDFVPTPDGVAVLEVNPRMTAAVDVFDVAAHTGNGPEGLVYAHARSCRGESVPLSDFRLEYTGVKAVYFAPRDIVAPEPRHLRRAVRMPGDVTRLGLLADLPEPGEVIGAGRPVLTLFAHRPSPGACMAELQASAAGLDALFAPVEAAAWTR